MASIRIVAGTGAVGVAHSIRIAVSAALIEIVVGAVAGNLIALQVTDRVNFLSGFGAILLTFLAGAEIDPRIVRKRPDQSTILVTAVIVGAVVPTLIAQTWFQPEFKPIEGEPKGWRRRLLRAKNCDCDFCARRAITWIRPPHPVWPLAVRCQHAAPIPPRIFRGLTPIMTYRDWIRLERIRTMPFNAATTSL